MFIFHNIILYYLPTIINTTVFMISETKNSFKLIIKMDISLNIGIHFYLPTSGTFPASPGSFLKRILH